MSRAPDVFRLGQQRERWAVVNGEAGLPGQVTCDVAIIGTGAGAGVTAEVLTRAGLDVVLIEEGPLRTSSDFNQREDEAYTSLYQESTTRSNLDNSVTILQGRCVGGSTVVNWTSSFRTPARTLAFWQAEFGLKDLTVESMAPYFAQVESRLAIQPWALPPNRNNELLRTGARRLGVSASVIPRNVKGCANLGSCGMGCPVNAKQSMLVTTIPAALQAGARLYHQTRAERLEIRNGAVEAVSCVGIRLDGQAVAGNEMRVVARHVVVAGGAINSPALLLRSDAPDPHGLLGTRTFLHPVAFSSAVYPDAVQGWAGAPQSIFVDHHLDAGPLEGPIGFKIEATPLHPGLMSVLVGGIGPALAERVGHYPRTQMLLALMRDGFHPEAAGGSVKLNVDGSPVLLYTLTPYVLEGFRRAYLAMAELQFAAGARMVLPYHVHARYSRSWAEARTAIEALEMRPFLAGAGSAHVMGGCRMAGTEAQGVVRPDGTHWQVGKLSVHDGSLFPTSIGANPQVSIYALCTRLAQGLAQRLTGKAVALV